MTDFEKLIEGLNILSSYKGSGIDFSYGSPGLFVTNGRSQNNTTIPLSITQHDSHWLESIGWQNDGVAWYWYN